MRGALDLLLQASVDLAADAAAPDEVLDTAPDEFVCALQTAAGALSEHFNQHLLNVGALLNFHFELQRFLSLVDARGEHSLFDVQTFVGAASGVEDKRATPVAAREAVLCVRNVAPACFLRQRFAALHGVTLFSATRAPPDYAMRLLGCPNTRPGSKCCRPLPPNTW